MGFVHYSLDSHAIKFNFVTNGIILTRLFPFPGFLLEVSGAVFIAYGLITSRSMLVAVGAVMLGLGLLLTVFGLLLRFRRNGPEEP
jgi:hypothetical protein